MKFLSFQEGEGIDPPNRLRLAIIGGGEGATKAIKALSGYRYIDIRAVVCKDTELVDLIEPLSRIVQYHEVLTRTDIDAVYIATPNSTHIPLAIQAIEARKHVLIEKPLGISTMDAGRLKAYRSKGILIAVAFKKRFGTGVQFLRELQSKKGEPSEIYLKWHINSPKSKWHYDSIISGGGVIMDLGSHVFDLLEYLFGEIYELRAQVEMSKQARDVEDVAGITLKFKTGSKAYIELNWASETPCQSLTLCFGSSEIVLERVNLDRDLVRISSSNDISEYSFNPNSEYRGLLKHFCETLWSGNALVPTIDVGIRDLVLIEAAYKSAHDGRSVVLS